MKEGEGNEREIEVRRVGGLGLGFSVGFWASRL
jgi:hypothetical protein